MSDPKTVTTEHALLKEIRDELRALNATLARKSTRGRKGEKRGD